MRENEIKIIFWGTPDFALPSLEALVKKGCHVVAVVTNPNELAGRNNIPTSPPVKVFAQRHKIPVLQPVSLQDTNFKKEIPEADLFIVASYGKIIPKDILELPKLGALNVHPSLLPRWRGPSPIQYTILNGDTKTGTTIMEMDERMDHGAIIAKSKIKNQISKITYKELHDELAKLGAELLIETLPKWLNDEITPISQDDSKVTYSKILKKDDGRIDWKKSAEEIGRMVRAFNPWPGTWTLWPADQKIYRLKIEEVQTSHEEVPYGSPGYVWSGREHLLLVKTGRGAISVKRLTLEGKKSLKSEEFLRGYPKIFGSTLI